MRHYLQYLIPFFFATSLSGQVGSYYPDPARTMGLAGINTVLSGSDAILTNTSFLAGQTGLSYIVGIRNDFLLSELRQIHGGVSYTKENRATLGLRISSFGFAEYKESMAQLFVAKKLTEMIGLSLALGMTDLQIEEFGSRRKFNFEISAKGLITQQLGYGIVVSNIEGARLTDDQKLVSRIAFGLRYGVSDKVRLYSQLEGFSYSELNAIVGFEYELGKVLSVRSGYNITPGSISLGCSVRLPAKLYLDIGFNGHRVLGNSLAFSVKSALH